MPVFLNPKYTDPELQSGLNWPRVQPGELEEPRSTFLHIGLVNNMGDAAMGATEHQFLTLLEAAAADMLVHVTLYALPEVERKPFGRRRVGKTRLLTHWMGPRQGLYSQAIEGSKDIQLEQVFRDLRERLTTSLVPKSWNELLAVIASKSESLKKAG